MRKLLFVFFILIVFKVPVVQGYAPPLTDTSTEVKPLRVRSYKQYTYFCHKHRWKLEEYALYDTWGRVLINKYDSYGVGILLTSRYDYSAAPKQVSYTTGRNNKIQNRSVRRYDEYGREIEYKCEGEVPHWEKYQYDTANYQSRDITYEWIHDSYHESKGPLQVFGLDTFRIKSDAILKFSHEGKLMEVNTVRYTGKDAYVTRRIFKYDTANRVSEIYGGSMNQEIANVQPQDILIRLAERYTYNSSGKLIDQVGYQEDSSLDFRWMHKYDSKGNCIEDSSISRLVCSLNPYDLTDDPIYVLSVKKTIYNGENQKIETAEYNSLGELENRKRYFYNKQGRLAAQWHYNEKNKLGYKEKTVFRYYR